MLTIGFIWTIMLGNAVPRRQNLVIKNTRSTILNLYQDPSTNSANITELQDFYHCCGAKGYKDFKNKVFKLIFLQQHIYIHNWLLRQ